MVVTGEDEDTMVSTLKNDGGGRCFGFTGGEMWWEDGKGRLGIGRGRVGPQHV